MKRLRPAWGSHLPVLIKAMQFTTGDVVECGCGHYSTPFLHWACFDQDRTLKTYEGNEEWYSLFTHFQTKKHSMQYITDWDSIDLSIPIGLAFIDHGSGDHTPGDRRWKEAQRLLHADLVVLHDAGGKDGVKYGYDKLKGLFKYTWMYRKARPMTAIVSNKLNCRKLFS